MRQSHDAVLDPLETTGFLQPYPAPAPDWFTVDPHQPFGDIDPTPSQTFRHNGWADDRDRVLAALKATHQTQQRVSAFCDCGSHAYVLKSTEVPPRYKVVGSTCHDRFCVPCATERARLIAVNAIELIGTIRVRFITLTIRQTDIGLSATLDRLLDSFKLLRKTDLWRKSVSGGVGFTEVKLNPETREWNVHMHMLCTGKYMSRDLLSDAWLKCTGDSFVVHIMLPKGHRHVIRYVTKYASKPLNTSFSHDPAALQEAVEALKGRRLLTTFGGWKGLLKSGDVDSDGWERIASLEDLLQRSIDGDDDATAILAVIREGHWTAVLEGHPASPRPPPPDTRLKVIGTPTLPGIDAHSRSAW